MSYCRQSPTTHGSTESAQRHAIHHPLWMSRRSRPSAAGSCSQCLPQSLHITKQQYHLSANSQQLQQMFNTLHDFRYKMRCTCKCTNQLKIKNSHYTFCTGHISDLVWNLLSKNFRSAVQAISEICEMAWWFKSFFEKIWHPTLWSDLRCWH